MASSCTKCYSFRKYTDISGVLYSQGVKVKEFGNLEEGKYDIYHFFSSTLVVFMQAKGCKGSLEISIISENDKRLNTVVKILDKI